MRGSSSSDDLDNLVQFRASDPTQEFLDDIADSWGLDSRSEAIRIIIHSWAGLLNGNFWAVTDSGRLEDEWGDVGYLLASVQDSKNTMPDSLQRATLLDVIADIPILLGAAEQELGLHPPSVDVEADTNTMPNQDDEV